MKRHLKLLWANTLCEVYLLYAGIFKSECKLVLYGLDHRVCIIGTCTGSFFKKNVKLKRVFYNAKRP